jgi:Notch-like protein
MIIFCLQQIELIIKLLKICPRIVIIALPWITYHKLLRTCSQIFIISTHPRKKLKIYLKSSNCRGYNEISTKVLKASSYFINSPLTCVCYKSLSMVIFHSCLKYSVTKPLFKKGDRNSMFNYRPISLLTSFLKIFEKVIYARLYQHLIDKKILVEELIKKSWLRNSLVSEETPPPSRLHRNY